jgi:hypothetical protein
LWFTLGSEPPTGEHYDFPGCQALGLDRALAGGEEGLTAGGMTMPMSTDPLGRGRALLRLYRKIVTRGEER